MRSMGNIAHLRSMQLLAINKPAANLPFYMHFNSEKCRGATTKILYAFTCKDANVCRSSKLFCTEIKNGSGEDFI